MTRPTRAPTLRRGRSGASDAAGTGRRSTRRTRPATRPSGPRGRRVTVPLTAAPLDREAVSAIVRLGGRQMAGVSGAGAWATYGRLSAWAPAIPLPLPLAWPFADPPPCRASTAAGGRQAPVEGRARRAGGGVTWPSA